MARRMPRSSGLLRSLAERTAVVHIALLGDSILDNSSFRGGEPDVVTHLRALQSTGARATLLGGSRQSDHFEILSAAATKGLAH
jgi:hypothetical protein